MLIIKQSTLTHLLVGPFVDKVDGFTPVAPFALAAITLASVQKANATGLTDIKSLTWTSVGNGLFVLDIDTATSDTAGTLVAIFENASTFRPIRLELMVLEANAYHGSVDSLATLQTVNVTQMNGDTVAVLNLQDGCDSIVRGAVVVGTLAADSFTTNLGQANNNAYNGQTIRFKTGANAGLAATISGYNAASALITCTGFPQAPTAADQFVIS